MPNEPLRLDQDALYSPKVEAYLEEQAVLRRAVPEEEPRPWVVRLLYSSYFYLSIAAALGGFCGWALVEPFLDDQLVVEGSRNIIAFILAFPTITALIGLFLGAAEGIMSRNLTRALICGSVGLGIGFGGGLIAVLPSAFIFGIMAGVAAGLSPDRVEGEMPHGIALLVFMSGRASAWALSALPAGLGQGIALRERKVILNGLLGGALGGLLGGLLFDPIYLALHTPDSAAASRAVGFTVIGLLVGLFVGLVEQWTKTAWMLMKTGPLAGKQFVLYRNPTVLGSSPKADVYLFKDEAIEPRHCLIHNRGGRFEIEALDTEDGTYVNGIPIQKKMLQSGDQIVLGKTLLEFVLKDA